MAGTNETKDSSSGTVENKAKSNDDEKKDEPEETEEEYRLRVYGMTDIYGEEQKEGEPRRAVKQSSSIRRLSRQVSAELWRRRSSFVESLPETPKGWAVLVSTLSSAVLGYEIQLQKRLTCPPTVYGQCNEGPLRPIYEKLTGTEDSILQRNIQPSLFVGTRAVVASGAAFLLGGPSSTDEHIRFRQILTMTQDGAKLAVDWELPPLQTTKTDDERKQEIVDGPIEQPVILILHGMNNDASFGYIKSFMRTCTDRGWVAAGMNLRGCGGVPLATPRGYNGAYTGDIRCVVQHISARLADNVPLFLVGMSLGANLVAKYLGEEGLSNTLPKCVAGGVTLGNPMAINSTKIDLLWSPLMALGTKKTLLESWSQLRHMTNPSYRSAIRKAMTAFTLADFDEAMAPISVRNDPVYPFAFRFGFDDGQAYWEDASSYKPIRHISVPMLQVIAADDFLVFHPFRGRLAYCLANPNVMIVETKCGGHLGWQEAPPDGNSFGVGTSWSDVATADFVQAVLETHQEKAKNGDKSSSEAPSDGNALFPREQGSEEALRIRSRL